MCCLLLVCVFGAVPKWSWSIFPETFAGTGAKHYAGHVIAAFTDEESWCQLKPVTGLSSTPERDQASCLYFTNSSFVPEQVGMDNISWREADDFSLQCALDCFRTRIITSGSRYFSFEESPVHPTFQGLLFLRLH